jgi:hypothetical protein
VTKAFVFVMPMFSAGDVQKRPEPLQSIIDIEKSRLPSHRIISDPSVTMESERQRIGEVLRSIQLTPNYAWDYARCGGDYAEPQYGRRF